MSIKTMLEFEEGRKNRAYPDPLTGGAPWTIGIGHTGPEVHEGLVWTDAQVDSAFRVDLGTAFQACLDRFSPWFSGMSDARQAILVSMMFQMGPSRLLKFVNTLNATRLGRYAAAAAGMKNSLWARQTPLRADRAARQMQTGVWNPSYLEPLHGT